MLELFIKQLDCFLGRLDEVKAFIAQHDLNISRPEEVSHRVKKYFNKLVASTGPIKVQREWMPSYIRQADLDTGIFFVREFYSTGGRQQHQRKPAMSKAAFFELIKRLVENTTDIRQDIVNAMKRYGGKDAANDWIAYCSDPHEAQLVDTSVDKNLSFYYANRGKGNTSMVDTEEAFAKAIKCLSVCSELSDNN